MSEPTGFIDELTSCVDSFTDIPPQRMINGLLFLATKLSFDHAPTESVAVADLTILLTKHILPFYVLQKETHNGTNGEDV